MKYKVYNLWQNGFMWGNKYNNYNRSGSYGLDKMLSSAWLSSVVLGNLPIEVVVGVVSIVWIFINSDSSDATLVCSGKFSSTAIPSSRGVWVKIR